jgi:hypothetical protein
MDHPTNTGAPDDEGILTYTVSDEAMEVAADKEQSPVATIVSIPPETSWCC